MIAQILQQFLDKEITLYQAVEELQHRTRVSSEMLIRALTELSKNSSSRSINTFLDSVK